MPTPTYDYIAALAGKVAWWPLSAADPTNEEVGGLDLTLINSPTTGVDMGFTAGDTGISFVAASTQAASRAHDAAFNPGTSDWSVAFWAIIPTSDATTRYIVAHNGNGGTGSWDIRHTSANLSMRFVGLANNSAFTANSTVKFIVINNDRDAVQRRYIDGSQVGSDLTISGDQTSQAETSTLYLARRETTGHGDVTLAHVVLRDQLWTTQEMTDAMAARLSSGASAAVPRSLSSLRSLRALAR